MIRTLSVAVGAARRTRPIAALVLCLATAAAAQQPAERAWTATWGTAQQYFQAAAPPAAAATTTPAGASSVPPPAAVAPPAPGVPARRFGIPPRIAGLNNQTVRMIARTSIGGDQLRIRLFNAIGGRSVRLGAAHLALRRSGSAIVPGSDRILTFSSNPSVSGSNVYTDAGEAIREAANQWIRKSGEFDAVVDFDAATRDTNDPKRFRPEADSPDLLHPGDAGYRLMAQAFDLAVFAPSRAAAPRR